MMIETSTDCRSEIGVTVGLFDGVIAILRILAKRDLSNLEVQEALKDLVGDEDLKFVLNSVV